jgi:hypothetical protein
MAEQQKMSERGKSDTVKVRVKHGRLLVKRVLPNGTAASKPEEMPLAESQYAEAGDVVEVDRVWAESLFARKLEGYPGDGLRPGLISDCPIELVA